MRAGIVHRLVGHAGRDRAVADDADDVVVVAGEIARDRHAEAGGNRGRGMRRAEAVVFALRALGEAGEAAACAQGADAVAAAGQDLVRIGLVADVPDQLVIGRVEDVMQRDRQLDDAEAGAEMAAGHRDRVDGLGRAIRRQPAAGRRALTRRRSAGVCDRLRMLVARLRREWKLGAVISGMTLHGNERGGCECAGPALVRTAPQADRHAYASKRRLDGG